jgi:hypothetical protein
MEKCNAAEATGVSVVRGSGTFTEQARATGVYTATLVGTDGQVKWTETFDNLVTTQGKNFLLDTAFAGSANNVRMSLITSATTPLVTDTYATPTGGTTEAGSGVIGTTRPTPSFSAASAGSKATSSAVSFSIVGSATISGCMLVMAATLGTLATVGNTATSGGVLYSAGTFSGGSKAVTNGDTLNVTYTASL